MSSNEEVAPVDVDGMSDEELDSFLDEHTEVGSDMSNLDVVDEPDEEEVPAVEEISLTEETTTEDVNEEDEEETTSSLEEEELEEGEETPSEEEELVPYDMSKYGNDELAEMSGVYDELFKTGIKASGVDRTVRDPEHLKTLVRIAFSANENNRKIKPYLRQLKSLEQAGVNLEDDNLNFLVDVMNGDKDAIKELITNKHKIDEDTLQSWIDNEDETKVPYRAKDHVISDSRFQLEEILDGIKGNDSYDNTVKFLGNIDDDGKVLISENPELVNLLNTDMENGIFDKALDEAYFRMDRGLLPKQSILQSYIQVMQDQEFYNSLMGNETPEVTNTEPNEASKQKKEVVNRKKRASNSGSSSNTGKQKRPTQTNTKDINKMSDEEFDEFYDSLDLDD